MTLHCYHVSNVSLLVLEVLRCQEQDNGGKPQDQICFPAPTSVARPQSVRCNHNPDCSSHAGGSCGKENNTNKKEEKVCSCVSTKKKSGTTELDQLFTEQKTIVTLGLPDKAVPEKDA